MNGRRLLVGIALLALLASLLAVPGASAQPAGATSASSPPPPATPTGVGGHYIPQVGDKFVYGEYILLDNGAGNYSGYASYGNFTGSEQITSTLSNGTEGVYFQNTGLQTDNQGNSQGYGENGNFTFNAGTFLYVQGTDDEPGYVNPEVWFYMNNSLSVGSSFEVLNTPMTVESTDYAYDLPGTGYVTTIMAEGQGSYPNTPYGDFTATYTWQMFFAPGTGYIVGYSYVEQDVDASGNAFSYTDTLWVTNTTYHIPSASAPLTDTLTFDLGCGFCSLIFNGANYTNGQTVSVDPVGYFLLAWYVGNEQTFDSWGTTAGTLSSSSSEITRLTVSSSGSVTPSYTGAPTAATYTIMFSVTPNTCQITFDGQVFDDGDVLLDVPAGTYSISAQGCSGEDFASWSTTAGSIASASSSSTTFTVTGSATLTANYNAGFPWLAVVLLLVFLLIFIYIIYRIVRRRRRSPSSYGGMQKHSGSGVVPYGTMPSGGSFGAPAPLNMTPSDQPGVQQIVIKETVKVPCQYCGTLIDSTATACPKCGAPRT